MPPPVSSEDKFTGPSVDELGMIQPDSTGVDTSGLREDRAGAANAVSRALKALVTGKTVVKKHHTRVINKPANEHLSPVTTFPS